MRPDTGWWTAFVVVVGCAGRTDAPFESGQTYEDVGCDTDGFGSYEPSDTALRGCVDCPIAIKPVLPADGETDVFYRTGLVVAFTADEHATATFRLVSVDDDDEVALEAATWSDDGKQASLHPVEALEPNTAYALEVTFTCTCGAPTEIAFSTGSTGAPVDPAAFSGEAYALDLSTGTWVQPPGVSTVIRGLTLYVDSTIALVFDRYDSDAETIGSFEAIVGVDGVADVCLPTVALPPASYADDPFFEIAAPDGIALSIDDVPITLLDAALSGAFIPDGAALDGVRVTGILDTRTLLVVLRDLLQPGDDAACELFATFTSNVVDCEDCPDGTGPYCVPLDVIDVDATRLVTPPVRRTAEDVAADEACATP